LVAESEQLIAEIREAQRRLQHLFAYDRADPLFSSHLTVSQLRILLLLSRGYAMSGGEIADRIGVKLAALSGMIDRLVVGGLVLRQGDPHDRRVRRISLSPAGTELIDNIINAGAERQRGVLDRLSPGELATVASAMRILVRAAEQTVGADVSGEVEGARRG
jgi:DNA-binding MarR family transcriptional regulator